MNLDTIKSVALGTLIGIAVVGVLLAIVVKKIVGKIISLVLAAVLVFLCWQQRDKVLEAGAHLRAEACATAHSDPPTFFGIRVTVPADWCAR